MKLKKKLAVSGLVVVSMVALVACNGASVLNGITPSGAFAKTKDVSYGPLARQALDVYRAETPKAGAPTVVFIHGGSWAEGSKNLYKFMGDAFASAG